MKKLTTSILSLAMGIGGLLAGSQAIAAASPSPFTRSGASNGTSAEYTPAESRISLAEKVLNSTPGDFTMSPSGTVFNTMLGKKAKAPARVGAAGGTMYAWVDYDADGKIPQGVAEVDIDGTVRSIVAVPLDDPSYRFIYSASYIRDGKIVVMGTQQYNGFGTYWFNNAKYVYEFDMEGKQLSKFSIPNYNTTNIFTTFAYDAEHDILYGQYHNPQGYQVQWGYASGAEPYKVTWVGKQTDKTDVLYAMTFNQVTGKIIGIKATGEVVEIAPETGKMTKVGEVAPLQYETAIAWSPYDGGYYYGLCTDAQCGVQLLGEDFKVISTADLGRHFEFMSFYTSDVQKILTGAPGATTYLGNTFAKGSHNGTLKYKLATATHQGTPILGDISWSLTMDGTVVRRGTAAAGSEVDVKLTDVPEGMHTFVFTASLAGKDGLYVTSEFYVGNDTPVAPANVKLTGDKVTWGTVTEGVHNGYVDAAAVTYNVYLNGEEIAKGIKDTECSTGLKATDNINLWEAAVEAVFDGKISEQGASNDLVYGEAMDLPVSLEPTLKESKLFTITDNNFSPGEIKFVDGMLDASEHFTGFQYSSSRYDANDWLYLPPIKFTDADAVYEFSMNVFRTNFNKEESFEVKLLTAVNPNSAVATIMPEGPVTDSQGNNYEHYQNGYFQVPEAGVYYIGIHCTSKASAGIAWFRHFSVDKDGNTTGACPAVATDIAATGAEKGELSATVTFTLPTTSINGTPYAADAVLTGRANADGCRMVTKEGKPGETVTITIPTVQGDNNVTVTAADAEGHIGLPAYTTVYTGLDYPGLLDLSYDVSENDLTLLLSWKPLSEGANGGYVESTGVTYYLAGLINGSWQIVGRIGTDVYECRVNAPAGSGPAIYTYGVIPVTVAGQAPVFNYVTTIMCVPFEMPFLSDYKAGNTTGYTYNRTNTSAATGTGDPKTRFPQFATDDNAKAYYCYPAAGATFPLTYDVALTKVSTLGSQKATLELNIFGGCCDSLDVYASANGVPSELVKTIAKEDVPQGPTKVQIELPAKFQNKGWVEIELRASLPENQSVIIYSYSIFDNVPNDFGVYDLAGPVQAGIGEECIYTAYLGNFGTQAGVFPGANWKIVDGDGNILAETDVPEGTETIATNERFQQTISYTPVADEAGSIKVIYTLAPGDNKAYNDSREIEVEVGAGLTPVITDLHANEVTFSSIELEWTNPDHSGPVVESFEDETPFVLDSESDMLGQFKRYDGDKAWRYTLGNGAVDKIPNSTAPASFMVWSESQVDQLMGGKVIPAVTGDKFLVAFCPQKIEGIQDVAADDWLISPELVAGSDFSFWMRPITYQYGEEEVTVLYSTGTDAREEFKELGKVDLSGEGVQGVWKQFSFTLPEGAKYFAIHYTSRDKMGIAVDDIKFSPVGSDIAVTGFNLFRNGELLAGNITAISYTDEAVEADTDYTYTVLPLLNNGTQGLMSNTLHVRTTGIDGITPDGLDGAEYYELNGLRVYGKLQPGVYIRKKGNDVRRIVVAK